MSDNFTANAGSGGDTFAADDIGGVKYPRGKISIGADGAAADCAATNPLPIGGNTVKDGSGTVYAFLLDSDGHLQCDVVGFTYGAGAVGATTPRVTHASDDPVTTAVQLIDDTIFADDAAFTVGTSKVQAVGFIADETATDSVDEGDVGAARMTLDRKVHVAAELESNAMRAGGTACTPKYAAIDAAGSGDNTLVTAVSGKKIRVLSLFLMAAGTVNVRFESGAGGTALTGQMNLVANNGFVLPFNPAGWFETAATTLLNLELSAAISVDGSLTYIEV